MNPPATGELAAHPASREELQDLNSALHERLRDAQDELRMWRAWGEAMPMLNLDNKDFDTYFGNERVWMTKRPQP